MSVLKASGRTLQSIPNPMSKFVSVDSETGYIIGQTFLLLPSLLAAIDIFLGARSTKFS
jgi:hypothetical protein